MRNRSYLKLVILFGASTTGMCTTTPPAHLQDNSLRTTHTHTHTHTRTHRQTHTHAHTHTRKHHQPTTCIARREAHTHLPNNALTILEPRAPEKNRQSKRDRVRNRREQTEQKQRFCQIGSADPTHVVYLPASTTPLRLWTLREATGVRSRRWLTHFSIASLSLSLSWKVSNSGPPGAHDTSAAPSSLSSL
jgi:hypothetical protein